jgi:hypothetical protein
MSSQRIGKYACLELELRYLLRELPAELRGGEYNWHYTPAELATTLGVTEMEVCELEAGQFPSEFPYILATLLRILENATLEKWAEHTGSLT